jgi:PmbA protein
MKESTLDLLRDAAKTIPGDSEGLLREAYYAETRELSTSACKGAIDSFTDSRSGAAALRVVASGRKAAGRRMGGAFTERIDSGSLAEAARAAEASAAFLDADEGNALYEGCESLRAGLDEAWRNDSVSAEAKKELALAIEKSCYGRDKRIVNVPTAAFGEVDSLRAIANGRGMLKAERHRLCYAYAYVIASEGDSTETGSYGEVVPDIGGLDAGRIAEKAVEEAIEKLKAVEPKSGSYRAIIKNDSASALLGAFMGAVSAEAIQKGKSRLEGKRGAKVGSKLFSIVDDPAASRLRHAAFDDEGVPAGRLEIFREGVFLEPLYTLYSARREGAEPNGRGMRGGASTNVAASLVNACIPAGKGGLEDLLSGIGEGILITDVQGLHAGLNAVSGDFSCSARGFSVQGGKKAGALRNFTVSGNFYDLIAGLEAVASDLREDVSDSFRSPSIAVASLSISGGD